ncbi:WhiB family transcriptional regulator [Streptomyces sp. NPDC001068]|uniref:WhiB family transcriptional regulator n=1 Tax=Streptomyces sp. NPDC001068 TaxID=3364544 RepID=UPI0036C8D96E
MAPALPTHARTGQHTLPRHGTEDPRFPRPQSPTLTRCQVSPTLFDFERGDYARKVPELAQARSACARCPLAADCLLWALVNMGTTTVGIIAGTTPRQRTQLRSRLAARLGPDWVDVLADREAARDRTAVRGRAA